MMTFKIPYNESHWFNVAFDFLGISMAFYDTTIYFNGTDTPMASGQGRLNL